MAGVNNGSQASRNAKKKLQRASSGSLPLTQSSSSPELAGNKSPAKNSNDEVPDIFEQSAVVTKEQEERPESVKQLIDEVAEEDVFYSVHSTEAPNSASDKALPDKPVSDVVQPVTGSDVESLSRPEIASENVPDLSKGAAIPEPSSKPAPSSLRRSIGAVDIEKPSTGGLGLAEETIEEDDGMIAPYDVFKHDPETFLRDEDKSLGKDGESQHSAVNDAPSIPSVNQAQRSVPRQPLAKSPARKKTGCCRCNVQ